MLKSLCLFACSCIVISNKLFAQSKPVIKFSTYIGGSGYEQVRDIVSDRYGNVYITGGTSSSDFPTTKNAFSKEVNRSGKKTMDAFVTKFDSNCNILWSTLLGGPEYDRAYAIEVDDKGFVYIAGRAGEGLPVTPNVFQLAFAGDNNINNLYGEQDGFVAKISPDGLKLVWCSYFGAGDRSFIRDIALDNDNNVYVVATDVSVDYKYVTKTAAQSQRRGGYDVVIAKISTNGDAVVWASYLGGSGDDFSGPSIRVNSKKHVVIAGTTNSTDLPITEDAFDKSFNGQEDICIAILDSSGNQLLLSTYLGGEGTDGTETHNLTLDKDDNIVIAATTSSVNFSVTPNAYQNSYGGNGAAGSGFRTNYPFDGFVAKLSPDGKHLIAATYFGGPAGEGMEGVSCDEKGNIYCSGATFSDAFFQSDTAFQRGNRGKGDQFLVCFSTDLKDMLYFSFIGGEEKDYGRTLHTGVRGTIFIGGESSSLSFPARNKFAGGEQDGTFTKFQWSEK